MAEEEAIDPDVAVGHDAVEVDEDALAAIGSGDGEGFAVPADAGGQESSSAASGVPGVERALDAPVVRQVEGAPRRIVEGGGLGAGGVGFEEAPALIERTGIRGVCG